MGYVGNVPSQGPVPRLDLEDGPQGVADGASQVTAWPSALTVVTSWDRSLMFQYGQAMGAEQYIKGTNIMLGPMINIARVPQGGRNFESYGEDPVLAAELVAPAVQGIQSNPVLGCAKHFVDNSQENNRTSVSEVVPRRVQWELYYPAFASAVNAGVGTIMCSYNRINDTYACENNVTLTDLKQRMGFDGQVMSDWGATHSTVQAALSGLDQQMPDASFFGQSLAQAVANGQVPESRIDDMVLRILVPMYAVGLFDNPPTGNLSNNAMSSAHNQLARTLAGAGTVLLKNDGGVLPVNPKAQGIRTIAVIGDEQTVTGGGSGHVNAPYIITPFQGISSRANNGTMRPVNCTVFQNTDFYQPGNPEVAATSSQDCCAQCTANPECNFWTYEASSGSCWLKPNNAGYRNTSGLVSGQCSAWPAGAVTVLFNNGSDPVAAAKLAASADIAIVVVATSSHEGSDRANLSLPAIQDQLVAAVAAVQKNTIVNVRTPGSVLMPWVNDVPAIVLSFMPGQEAGNALADILFGDVNPSGRLPLSFLAAESDSWLQSPNQYPGVPGAFGWPESVYTEGLLMGYRHFDAHNIDPLFPFGHGLSYTTFTYSNPTVSGSVSGSTSATLTVDVANSGTMAGAEVVQLYIAFPASAGEPPKVLRDFAKVPLAAGSKTTVSFTLNAADCSIFDVVTDDWALVGGSFTALIGASSRDIRLSVPFTVAA